MPIPLSIPISDEIIRELHVGDSVLLSGTILTGRDAVHKWLYECFIQKITLPSQEDARIYKDIKSLLNGGLIYHCGPVVSGLDTKEYRFISAGPTTSIREEPYQAKIMRLFNLKGVIGKGGMGVKTLKACTQVPAVYFHAVGGAAALIAQSVIEVLNVYKLKFGSPEAMWVIRVKDFPAVVTMDAHGQSLHEQVRNHSQAILDSLIK